MGDSSPTVTDEMREFEAEAAGFRREANAAEKEAMAWLFQVGYRSAAARNRSVALDDRSRILLAMMRGLAVERNALVRRVAALEQQNQQLLKDVKEVGDVLGLSLGRPARAQWTGDLGMGQERLPCPA